MDDEFEELLAEGKLIEIWSWYNNLGLILKTHRDHYITWITFDEAFNPLQWAHLPRHQIIEENNRLAWVCRPSCGWVEISSGENIFWDAIYRSRELLFKRLVEKSASEEVLKTMEGYTKRSRDVPKLGTVEHNIGKHKFSLPNNCVPVTKPRLNSLELENQEMKSTIYALNEEWEEAKKILADNQPLVSLGAHLSKLKSINKRPPSLAADRFYDMAQAVMTK